MKPSEERPVIATIEVHYPEGLRILPVREPTLLAAASMEACDIWDEEGEKVRVRVVRRLPGGGVAGICHLLPSG